MNLKIIVTCYFLLWLLIIKNTKLTKNIFLINLIPNNA